MYNNTQYFPRREPILIDRRRYGEPIVHADEHVRRMILVRDARTTVRRNRPWAGGKFSAGFGIPWESIKMIRSVDRWSVGRELNYATWHGERTRALFPPTETIRRRQRFIKFHMRPWQGVSLTDTVVPVVRARCANPPIEDYAPYEEPHERENERARPWTEEESGRIFKNCISK